MPQIGQDLELSQLLAVEAVSCQLRRCLLYRPSGPSGARHARISDDPFLNWADQPRAPKHERAEGAVRRASTNTAGVPLKSAVRRPSLGVSRIVSCVSAFPKALAALLQSVTHAFTAEPTGDENGICLLGMGVGP